VRHHFFSFYTFLIALLLILFLISLFTGAVEVNIKDVFQLLFSRSYKADTWANIVIDFRLPKALTAIIAGSALSVSGLQMQALFRNPLAGPYVLGVSSGAMLGVATFIFGYSLFFSSPFIPSYVIILAALSGALLVLLLLLFISNIYKNLLTVLIFGILFGHITSAFIQLLQYISAAPLVKSYLVWTMGNISGVTYTQLIWLLLCVIPGLIIALSQSKALDLIAIGNEYALTSGININQSKIMLFISTGLLVGGVTAFCGPIGFIGLIIPHIARMVLKTSNHYSLFWMTLLLGAITLLLADIISTYPSNGILIPINTITSLFGIPILIWVIVRNRLFN
jgi:iron complex transport system permease protein